jgi:hypothetical protein
MLLAAPAVLAAPSPVFADNEWMGGVFGLVCCGGGALVGLAIEIYILYFMYTDAEARGQSGIMWAAIGFFLGLLGLIIWLIMRPEKKAP